MRIGDTSDALTTTGRFPCAPRWPPGGVNNHESALCLESSALLFPHILVLFYVLHLLYEDLKLDELKRREARALVGLLQQLAKDLQLEDFIDLSWRDYPSFIKTFKEACVIDQDGADDFARAPGRGSPVCVQLAQSLSERARCGAFSLSAWHL